MALSTAAELMESFVDDHAVRRGERLQESARTQREPHRHGSRVPAPVVHAAHALECDRASGPAKPHSHRALMKIVRSFHHFLCAAYDSLGTAIDQQNRIASRNVYEHQISTDLPRPLI